MKKYILLLLMISSVYISAQSSRISRITVTKIGGNAVEVIWNMPAGATCLDLSIQRSEDSIQFKTVYTYPSVCGSEDEETSYSWIDSNPIAEQINYYRLKLEDAEFTEVRTIDFRTGFSGSPVILYPNPSNNKIFVKVDENKVDLNLIEIYSVGGEKVFQSEILNTNEFELNISSLRPGIYNLQVITKTGKNYVEQFVVN